MAKADEEEAMPQVEYDFARYGWSYPSDVLRRDGQDFVSRQALGQYALSAYTEVELANLATRLLATRGIIGPMVGEPIIWKSEVA